MDGTGKRASNGHEIGTAEPKIREATRDLFTRRRDLKASVAAQIDLPPEITHSSDIDIVEHPQQLALPADRIFDERALRLAVDVRPRSLIEPMAPQNEPDVRRRRGDLGGDGGIL